MKAARYNPPIEVLSRLCAVLDISALDLLDKPYTCADILGITKKPAENRTYEEQIALNFCGSILERAQDKEVKRVERERQNRDYISETTGLTAAVAALTVDIDTLLFDETDKHKVSPVALEA
jgi:hypothetical protein